MTTPTLGCQEAYESGRHYFRNELFFSKAERRTQKRQLEANSTALGPKLAVCTADPGDVITERYSGAAHPILAELGRQFQALEELVFAEAPKCMHARQMTTINRVDGRGLSRDRESANSS